MDGLEKNMYIKEIDLSLNPLGDIGTAKLSEVLIKNKSIKKVILHASGITDKGMYISSKKNYKVTHYLVFIISFFF